ncbi:SgcJ/EcaC family oxidoreductase [Nonomuraea sp. FMUSA5-5]|uniref:SgcJ/EcaC family oxidoreductase n=1 Tax=Nonomuraea composti TaxID=2720023 RepID=A0ABX1BBV0_9ACTN|nr:SgcJ/EcaC family oxidoreductase [Nonomuraea sp. FMUSA5-5]NJP95273.1 SgcJ/EcaC family oxidoreductase [Nonomuraea sp. FMUSA5-5]
MITTAEQDVRTLFADLEDAWNRGDGHAYGACFTEDASYTTFVGTVYHGRDDLAAAHQALFDSVLKDTRMFNEITGIRFLGPGVAVVTGRGEVAKRRPRTYGKVQTYTLVREGDGRWRIAAFHNTQRKPLMEAVSFRFVPGSAPRK